MLEIRSGVGRHVLVARSLRRRRDRHRPPGPPHLYKCSTNITPQSTLQLYNSITLQLYNSMNL